MNRPGFIVGIAVALLAAVALVLVATVAELVPPAVRLPIVLVFVLFVPGAAFALALRVSDLLSFSVVAIGVSVALLVVLSELSTLAGGLSPGLVLTGLVVFTVACITARAVGMRKAGWGAGGSDRSG
jgi:hypothetical protein